MAETAVGSELVARLVSIAGAHGVTVTSCDERRLTGSQDAITAKWFLGGRKVVYRLSCDVDEASRTVRFRESAVESSWGIPPPSLTVEKTTQHGSRVSESRSERAVGGGGRLDYGTLRDALQAAVREYGWQFVLDTGKMP